MKTQDLHPLHYLEDRMMNPFPCQLLAGWILGFIGLQEARNTTKHNDLVYVSMNQNLSLL